MSDPGSDPGKPLKDVLTDRQIDYLREEADLSDLESILDSSLDELMESASKPDLTELMGQATDRLSTDDDE